MKARCQNPNNHKYPRYGGRGIVVCDRWQLFERFLEDMGPCPGLGFSIDRVDNDQGYFAENCRWGSESQQANNKSTNRLISCFGETKTLADWARAVGLKAVTIHQRIKRGWSVERALSELRHNR